MTESSFKSPYPQTITLTLTVEEAFHVRDVLFASDDDRNQGVWGKLANVIGPYSSVSADRVGSRASNGAGDGT